VTGPDDPIRFAERLLALLEEGSFTATYKFAVLLGLMDLCLEHSNRYGEPPPMVTTRQLAEKVVELYWSHTTPFENAEGDVLRQNAGKPAVILSRIETFRSQVALDLGCTLHRARMTHPREFESLLDKVEWTLVLMPLPKVQRFGGSEDRFIYDIAWDDNIRRGHFHNTHEFDNRITFVGDAARHLVRLAPLLRPLIQQKWVEMVGRLNQLEVAQLESFLFGADRVSLQPVRAPLLDLQRGACFYCGGRLRATVDVDHFFPWSRYPDDRLDNLVVAHPECNRQKKDFLASAGHLASWARRLSSLDTELDQIASATAWPRDTARSLGVIRGTYLKLPDGVALWHRSREFTPSRHRDLLQALAATR
jgi:5-methylcytosine-specific restriction endonuclease McrA